MECYLVTLTELEGHPDPLSFLRLLSYQQRSFRWHVIEPSHDPTFSFGE